MCNCPLSTENRRGSSNTLSTSTIEGCSSFSLSSNTENYREKWELNNEFVLGTV